MTPDQQRRLSAKRVNEGTKLSATLSNNLAVGLLIGGLIAPLAANRVLPIEWFTAVGIGASFLHFGARLIVHGLKSEE